MDLSLILSNFATPALVSAAITFALKGWFTARLENGIRHEYDLKLERARADNSVELEKLKSDLGHQKSLLEFAHKSLSEASVPLRQRRLLAIENVWKSLQAFENAIPAEMIPLLDYSDANASESLTPDNTRSVISALSSMGKTLSEASFERPFVGEYLWNMVFAYESIIIRIITSAALRPEPYSQADWFQDEITRKLIARFFGDSMLDVIDKAPVARFAKLRSDGIQRLSDAARIAASGHDETEELLARASKLAKAVHEANASI